MNTVTVIINDVEYNLRGKEDEKYLLDVAAYVDTKIKESTESYHGLLENFIKESSQNIYSNKSTRI